MAASPATPDGLPATVESGLGHHAPLDGLDQLAVCNEVERRLFGSSGPGALVGRYRILEAVGAGSFGVVYRAEDPELDRVVALKVLRRRVADHDAMTMLLSEARAMAKLAHQNVVHVYDAGVADGRVFVAMELVEGVTVRAWLGQRPRTPSQVLDVMTRAGTGLAAAHAAGLLHRDFKPDNVLVESGDRPRVRVTDFGLALVVGGEATTAGPQVAGTPGYMAPEQTSGGSIDARADQFAFCVSLWEALHGARPFDASTPSAFADAVVAGPRAAGSGVPSWLHKILRKGLHPSPDDRFASMDALLAAIEGAQRWRRRSRWVGAAVVVATATAALAYRTGAESVEDPCRAAAARIDEIWNDTRAASVREAFVRTKLAFAPTAASTVVGTIGEWRDSWQHEYRDACTQRRVRDDDARKLEARLSCLDRRLEALSLMVAELARVDGAAVERAPAIVAGMEGPAECAEATAPSDGTDEQTEALRTELARVGPLRLTGQIDEAAEIARGVANKAQDAAVEAEALYELGDLADRRGRVQEAAERFETAYFNAEAVGDDALAVRSAAALVYVRGAELAELAEARRWRDHAEAKLRRIDQPPRLRSALLHNDATVAYVAGEFERGLAAQQEVVAALETVTAGEGWADELQLAAALDNRGAILLALGRHEEARRDHEMSLEIHERTVGAMHPDAGSSWGSLGNVAHAAGNFEAAEQHFRTALEIFEQAPTRRPLPLASCHNNLGNVLGALGRWQEAAAEHERALELRRELFGATHPDVAQSLDNLGSAMTEVGKAAEAVVHHRSALAIRTAAFGDDHYGSAYSHHGLGRALAATGHWEDAVSHLQAAVDLRRRAEGPADELLAQTLFDLAGVLHERPEGRERARRMATLALAVLSDPKTPPEHKLRDAVSRWLLEQEDAAVER